MLFRALSEAKADSKLAEFAEYASTFKFPKCRGDSFLAHLFTKSKIASMLRKDGGWGGTASEFLTIVPVLWRYLTNVVMKRGILLPLVMSMIAVLDVVIMLQGVKCCCVDPANLKRAIKKHIDLYIAAYGKSSIRPKYHYVLHLPWILARFGVLLTTFTLERKHRVVKKYTKFRENLTNWNVCALEEITTHQVWELSLNFLCTLTTSNPTKAILHSLRGVFPGATTNGFKLHDHLATNGGDAMIGDIVSVVHDGRMLVGELLVTVEVAYPSVTVLKSFVSVWDPAPAPSDSSHCRTYRVQNRPAMFDTDKIDTVFVGRFSDSKCSCVLLMPYELQSP